MTPIVAGVVCGICGKPIEDPKSEAHWKTHSLWDRFRFWLRSPWIQVGPWDLRIDYTGMLLFHHVKNEAHPRVVWSWIWHRRGSGRCK